MPNTFLKPTVIAATAIGLLYRELVVARTIWTDAINPGEFQGAFADTVTMRVPARRSARTRTLRAGTAIVNDTSAEHGPALGTALSPPQVSADRGVPGCSPTPRTPPACRCRV